MKCTRCPRRLSGYGIWTKEMEAKAVAEGWWFYDRKGPAEQLGMVLCHDHNDRPEPANNTPTPRGTPLEIDNCAMCVAVDGCIADQHQIGCPSSTPTPGTGR